MEIEAQALAKQYEKIYRQTIRKMQMDIDNEQKSMRESEKAVESLMKEHK